MAETAE